MNDLIQTAPVDKVEDVELDEKPTLSPWAAAALRDFYAEQAARQSQYQIELPEVVDTDTSSEIPENWQLSQFWYDDATATALAAEALRLCELGDTIACVSCPTVYRKLCQLNVGRSVKLRLFEYDQRFESIAGADFVYYDYKEPRQQLPNELLGACRVVLADPPFLSDECLTKTLETVAMLANDKVILCTGAIMEDTVVSHPDLYLKACTFEPHHANKLANEFKCFANYNLDSHVFAP